MRVAPFFLTLVAAGSAAAAGSSFEVASHATALAPATLAAMQDERPGVVEPPPPPDLDAPGGAEGPVTLEEAMPEGAGEKVLPVARPNADPDEEAAVAAQVPLPPKVRPPNEPPPEVTIRTEGETTIEEYRRSGQIYMIRVQPPRGIAYTYLDTDGDGRLERDPGQEIEGPVQPVYFTIYEWE